eukprot:SAG31_NODE_14047_length_830_cov_1.062927_2_plen_52_part_01
MGRSTAQGVRRRPVLVESGGGGGGHAADPLLVRASSRLAPSSFIRLIYMKIA